MKRFVFCLIALFAIGLVFSGVNPAKTNVDAQSINLSWQFSLTGLVSKSLNFTLADLQNMPQTNVSASLFCVSSPTTVLEHGTWQGVKLWTLLTQAGISSSVTKIAFHAIDGFSTDLTTEVAKSDEIIVAYTLNGSPLSEVVRLVVPFHFGYKWINQITNIEAVDFDYRGTYESQGYSDDGILTQSGPPFPTYSNVPTPIHPTPTNSLTTPPKHSPNQSPVTSPSASTTFKTTPSSSNITPIVSWVIIVLAVVLVAVALLTLFLRKKRNANYPLMPQ